MKERLSDNNKRKGYGVHYSFDEQRIRSDYQKTVNKSLNITDILKETFEDS